MSIYEVVTVRFESHYQQWTVRGRHGIVGRPSIDEALRVYRRPMPEAYIPALIFTRTRQQQEIRTS